MRDHPLHRWGRDIPLTSPASVAVPSATALEPIVIRPGRHGRYRGPLAILTGAGAASVYRASIEWSRGRRMAGMVVGSDGRFVVEARRPLPR